MPHIICVWMFRTKAKKKSKSHWWWIHSEFSTQLSHKQSFSIFLNKQKIRVAIKTSSKLKFEVIFWTCCSVQLSKEFWKKPKKHLEDQWNFIARTEAHGTSQCYHGALSNMTFILKVSHSLRQNIWGIWSGESQTFIKTLQRCIGKVYTSHLFFTHFVERCLVPSF